jgi:D-alanyl-D-alanine dipeptidase
MLLSARAAPAELPENFVHLSAVDPTILQDIRYAGQHNFFGRPVPGYEAATCILTRPAAEALRDVQNGLREMALSLKVYDCYRPARAVEAFAAWTESEGGEETKAEFYPDIDKSELFTLGWLARRSGHSRGSAVDVTLVALPPPAQRAYEPGERLTPCDAPRAERFPDNGLDFGTGYDCFGEKSYTADC